MTPIHILFVLVLLPDWLISFSTPQSDWLGADQEGRDHHTHSGWWLREEGGSVTVRKVVIKIPQMFSSSSFFYPPRGTAGNDANVLGTTVNICRRLRFNTAPVSFLLSNKRLELHNFLLHLIEVGKRHTSQRQWLNITQIKTIGWILHIRPAVHICSHKSWLKTVLQAHSLSSTKNDYSI